MFSIIRYIGVKNMRQRKASRILVLDENNRVLLFHFLIKPSTGKNRSFWATPGGEINKGETSISAAKRELFEETGLNLEEASFGDPVWKSEFEFRMNNEETVLAHEQFFVVRLSSTLKLSHCNWTHEERNIISGHKWWSIIELKKKPKEETIYPADIVELLEKVVGVN